MQVRIEQNYQSIEVEGASRAIISGRAITWEVGGARFSHIIDPRTGEPVAHGTVSSTVLAADCMRADALATMLMVMNPADAIELARVLGAAFRALSVGAPNAQDVRVANGSKPLHVKARVEAAANEANAEAIAHARPSITS